MLRAEKPYPCRRKTEKKKKKTHANKTFVEFKMAATKPESGDSHVDRSQG